MDQKVKDLAEKLLQTGYDELPERDQKVLRRIASRVSITKNVNEQFRHELSFGQRLADRVAAFGGSWVFIMIFGAVLVLWVALNAWLLPNRSVYDPYPFVFLNLILSMIAAFQAPIIMMSQNRQTAKDRLSASLDYEINLKSELEIMQLHDKLDALRLHQLEIIIRQQSEHLAEIRQLIQNKTQ